MAIKITRATAEDVPLVTPLFNAYRMFYGKHSDIGAAGDFLTARLQNNQSVVFMAMDGDKAIGFTQLYPIFSSVGLKNAWLLNDMYVSESYRGQHISTQLLEAAKELGRQTNSGWLMLQTAATNHIAQKAYESNGWQKDEEYYVYNFNL